MDEASSPDPAPRQSMASSNFSGRVSVDGCDGSPQQEGDGSSSNVPQQSQELAPNCAGRRMGEASSSSQQPAPSDAAPQKTISRHPNRTDAWANAVPGNSTYSEIVKHGRKVVLFSDSICNRFNERDLNNKLHNSRVKKKAFPGATSVDLAQHYIHPHLNKNNTPDTVIIHAGANDIFFLGGQEGELTREHIEEVCQNILTCGMACKQYGINKIALSSVLPGRKMPFNLSAMHINNILEQCCEKAGFDFIRNTNIVYNKPTREDKGLFFYDGLHLNDDGRDLLMQNFIDYLNNRD